MAPLARAITKLLEAALRNEVLKRELVEGEEADRAEAVVKKALRAAAREKRKSAKAVPPRPPAAAPSAPPPAVPLPSVTIQAKP